VNVVIIGDTHFGSRNDSDNFMNYFLKFYDDVLFPYIEKNHITDIIQTGDLMDKRKGVSYKTLATVSSRFFDKLKALGCTVHTIPGNHDIYYRHSTKVNSMTELFSWRDEVKIYNQPTTVKIGGLNIDFIPWIANENRDEVMKFVSDSTSSCLVGHLELDGFELLAGIQSSGGMNIKAFESYSSVISGHYHHRSSRKNITYVGTPYEMTWSDFADPKGFHVFDTDTLDLTFVKNHHKMFRKVFYSSDVDYTNFDFDELTNAIVKVIVQDRDDIPKFEALVAKITDSSPLDLTIVESDITVVEGIDEDSIEGVDTFNVPMAAARTTAEFEGLDADKTERILTELYHDAIDIGRDN